MKPNYEYKAQLMREGLHHIERHVRCSLWRIYNHDENEFTWSERVCRDVTELMMSTRPEDWKECGKINRATWARSARLYHRIENLLQSAGGGLFLTLTFTDDVLATTTAQTRRTYVTRYLKELPVPGYIANIDYGSKNHREHYHAVVGTTDKISYEPWHKIGAIKGEKIKIKDTTSKKLGKYVAKLTNHAIKITTKRQAVIYSR